MLTDDDYEAIEKAFPELCEVVFPAGLPPSMVIFCVNDEKDCLLIITRFTNMIYEFSEYIFTLYIYTKKGQEIVHIPIKHDYETIPVVMKDMVRSFQKQASSYLLI